MKTANRGLSRNTAKQLARLLQTEEAIVQRFREADKEGEDLGALAESIKDKVSYIPLDARRLIHYQRASQFRVAVTAQLDLHDYGALHAASKLHNMSMEELLSEFIQARFCDWSNDGFPLE